MKSKMIVMMMFCAAMMMSVPSVRAAEKYVQSAGSSVFTIDRDAGTITRHIRSSYQGGVSQSETLSCKYGYIVTLNGESTAMLDLLAPLNDTQGNDLARKRVEGARKDCQMYNIEVRF